MSGLVSQGRVTALRSGGSDSNGLHTLMLPDPPPGW
jgi:hypothetical protein